MSSPTTSSTQNNITNGQKTAQPVEKEGFFKKYFGWMNGLIGIWLFLLIISALIAWFYVGCGACSVAECSATSSFYASYD